VPGDRLSQDEVATVLRRAAELDPETTTPAEEGVPVAALEAAAAEVGLPPAAVRQAVAELRAGVLGAADQPPLDPSIVVEAGVVPMAPDVALGAVGRWLAGQTFHRHGGRDGVEVWRLREDWFAGIQRSLDWSASMRLKQVRQVVVRAVAVEGGTLVRLEAAVGGIAQAAPVVGAAATGTIGGTATVLSAVAFSPTLTALGAGLTGVGAVGGWLGGRSIRRGTHRRVRDELAAELDRIASGVEDRNALERLRDRARSRARGRQAWHRA
jgi:hypothetical protein